MLRRTLAGWLLHREDQHRLLRLGLPITGVLRSSMGLTRRAAAETVGTALLVVAVIGSGIAASRLSPGDAGLRLLENSLATGAALAVLIVVLQPLSAAFNPVITVLERILGVVSSGEAVILIGAQVAGGVVGAVLCNLMFGLPAITMAQHERTGPGVWLGEVIATAGLVLVIFGATRSGRVDRLGILVGGYITAAYWFTSSTSFANPAVTLARTLSNTFAGIAPSSVPMFLLAQLLGGGLGMLLTHTLFTQPLTALATDVASDSQLKGTP